MYLLDANVFIQAKRLYYGMDFCPGFWDWLDRAYANGSIATVRPVADELAAGADDLADWLSDRDDPEFVLEVDDEDTQDRYAEIVSYVYTAGYTPAAIRKFFHKDADLQLIAKSYSMGVGLVTLEKPHPRNSGSVHIPEICDRMGVRWIDTYELLRNHGARLVLECVV